MSGIHNVNNILDEFCKVDDESFCVTTATEKPTV